MKGRSRGAPGISILVLTFFLLAVQVPPTARALEVPRLAWVQEFGTPDRDFATAMALDAQGIYVAGCTNGSLPGQVNRGAGDAFLRGYDSEGNERWTREFGSPGMDCARAVASDGTGAYVAGSTWDALPGQLNAGASDGFLRKYDPEGNETWTSQFGTNQTDEARAVVSKATGLYVAGLTFGAFPGQLSAGQADAFVRRSAANGTELWTRQFGSPDGDAAFAIEADASGVYVAGVTPGTLPGQVSAGGLDGFVRQYDLWGNEGWTRQFGTTGNDEVEGIAVDVTGIYITGSTFGAFPGELNAGNADAFVGRFDLDGNAVWTRQFGTAGGDSGSGIATNGTGVYVTGFTDGVLSGPESAGQVDGFVRKYDFDGTVGWTEQFGSQGGDFPVAISVGPARAYVVGNTDGAFPGQAYEGDQDMFLGRVVTTLFLPAVRATPASVDFGTLPLGSTATTTVTISSVGSANLTIRGVSLASGGAGFSLSAVPTAPSVLPPGASVDIEVSFGPPASGPSADELRVDSDDPNAGLLDIPLRGAGAVAVGPVTSLRVGSPSYASTETYITSSTRLSFTAIDLAGKGIVRTAYRVDDGNWANFTLTGPFRLAGDGEHLVEWFSEDGAGTVEAVRSATLRVDDTPPATSVSPSVPPFPDGTHLELRATDPGCGVARTEYRIDTGDWITYTTPFAAPGEGHVVRYRSVDHLGNAEPERSLELPSAEVNWKPIIAAMFSGILLAAGAWSTKRSLRKVRERGAIARHLGVALVFVAAEACTGVVSALTGALSIPPLIGPGTAVDLGILSAGLAMGLSGGPRRTGRNPNPRRDGGR